MTLFDEVLKFRKEEQRIVLAVGWLVRVLLVPASIGSSMAYRTDRVSLDEQCVLIAVVENLYDIEEVARSLTFGP